MFLALGAGAGVGASVGLRTGVPRPLGVALLELTPGLATIGSGTSSLLAGLAAAIGAMHRIPVLSGQGVAAPADPTVTPELLAVWGRTAPSMLAMAGIGVGVAWVGLRVVGRFLPRQGPVSGDAV
jgi:hypothetical protein